MNNNNFPIDIPNPLPSRIDPCPIVESAFETRFVTQQPWTTIPGLLFAQIRDQYPKQEQLPAAHLPDDFRKQNPALQYLPLIRFHSDNFLIQVGPRSISLCTKPNQYPGWTAIAKELGWMIAKVQAAGFVGETERLSTRYIDFFDGDVFQVLRCGLTVNDQPLTGTQTDVTTILRRDLLTIRLQITNGAIAHMKDGPKAGSVLDVDGAFGPMDADLFVNGLERFAEAHSAIKGLFFGLLKPEFLRALNPHYE
jgi:uncharacterized protein (TIGR04255 family)